MSPAQWRSLQSADMLIDSFCLLVTLASLLWTMILPRIRHATTQRCFSSGTFTAATRTAWRADPPRPVRFRSLSTVDTPGIKHWTPPPRNLIKDRWEPIIGLEIHAQIKSDTKLFSDSRSVFNAPTNTNVSLIDAAYPGTLPVSSKEWVCLTRGMWLSGTVDSLPHSRLPLLGSIFSN